MQHKFISTVYGVGYKFEEINTFTEKISSYTNIENNNLSA